MSIADPIAVFSRGRHVSFPGTVDSIAFFSDGFFTSVPIRKAKNPSFHRGAKAFKRNITSTFSRDVTDSL